MTSTIAVIIILLACGIVAGFFMHRSDFCIAGMFRDIFLFKNRDKIKPLLALMGMNMILFHLLNFAGILKDLPFPWYTKPNWLIIPGGMIFGIGMVLAGSCVFGVLYKIGSGHVLAFVVFAGMIFGNLIFLFTAHKSSPVTKGLFISADVTVPQSLGIHPLAIAVPVCLILSVCIVRWAKKGTLLVKHYPDGYVQPIVSAAVIAIVSVISYYVVNSPLGVTTSYTKFSSYFIYLLSPETYGSMPVLSNKLPEYYNYFTGDAISGTLRYTTDGVSLVQYPVIFGIIAGSAVSAVMLGEFRLRFRVPVKHYVSSFTGGILLAYSSRIGLGCNIWHLGGGIPVLAWGGFLFLGGILAGAWFGSLILKKLIL